ELTCVTAMGDGGFCAVQKNGMLYLSKDGHKWEERNNSGSTNLLCADFYDDKNGVVAGDHTLSYTTDGGIHWQQVSPSMTVRSVSMPTADKAVMVGDNGSICTYKFGASSAQKMSSPSNMNLTSVDFYGATGYACGSNGTLLRSEDYGQTWESLEWEEGSVTMDWVKATDPTNSHTAQLNGICAVDARTAYAVGNGGVMLKTIDGGDTWSRRETSTTEDLTSMTVKPDGNLSVTAAGHVLTVKDGTDLYSVRYYYDRLGRLVASQNSKQHAMQPQRYSYTLYDALGRNVEAGELESDVEPTDAMINDTETRFPDNWSKKRYQVTRSVYDGSIGNVATLFSNKTQENLRGRIATTLYQEVYHSDVTQYDHATHYSYDIHGNVKELIHDLPELGQDRYKSISYDYDLVSGKVNQLDYQKGKPDGYSLRYEYDGENRIVKAYANYGDKDESGSETWHELANYEYYRHGPLARTVLGGNLQSVDYAYTLQGWTKGVNLDAESDATVKSDVYGYELQYNNEDYKPISSKDYRTVDAGATNLYNGNITAMTTDLKSPDSQQTGFGEQTRSFTYDELNRLKGSEVIGSKKYATSYTYDANGNILNLNRNDQSGSAMDQLTYHYATDSKGNIISNRLLHVNDGVKNAGGTDIKDQGAYAQTKRSTHNYEYDEIGNLIKDKSEEIAEIRWNV
nr:hypothetical protein [Bacteroidales bacterium]